MYLSSVCTSHKKTKTDKNTPSLGLEPEPCYNFSKEICNWNGNFIRWLSHFRSRHQTWSTKTIAISSFPTPKNIKDIRSFLGLANQLAFFLPDFSHLTFEMGKLLSTKNDFLWLDIHEPEFQKLKTILTSDLLVKTFDPNLDTILLTNASRLNGLGYTLLQKEKSNTLRLVTCGSCSLNETQNRFATIKLECLAFLNVVFTYKACQILTSSRITSLSSAFKNFRGR